MYAIGLCDDYFDSIEIATVVLISLQTAEVEKVVVVPEYTRVERMEGLDQQSSSHCRHRRGYQLQYMLLIQLMRKFDSL